MKTKLLTLQVFIFFLSATFLLAQNNSTVNKKLEAIKGEVNKIVISTAKGDVTFEGEDAKMIFKNMKSDKIKKLKWISEDDEDFDIDDENVMIFKSGKGGKHILKEFKNGENIIIMKGGDEGDFDFIENGRTIRVEVEDENGEKKVTLTTNEDGEEKVETFQGKEAVEYLENMENEHDMIINVEVDADSNEDDIWIHKLDSNDEIEKDVKIEINNGVKKITETTTENGEKSVKVYEGEEAEKYLKENNDKEKHIRIKHKMKDGKKHKKVIIKELKTTKEK